MSKSKPVSKKAKIFITVLIIIAVMAVCAAIIAAFSKTLVTEGTVELEPAPATALTQIPQSGDGIIAYLNDMLDDAKDGNRVAVDRGAELSVEDGSIVSDMGDSELAVLKYAKNIMLGKVSELYPAYDGSFGNKLGALPHISFDSSAAKKVECVRGAEDEQGNRADENSYFFTIELPEDNAKLDADEAVGKTFAIAETSAVKQAVKNQLAPMLDVVSLQTQCAGFCIEAKADCTRDEVDYIKLTRNYIVSARVEFKGEYESLGAHDIAFKYTVIETFDYTWAGISFINDEVDINRGEQDVLAVNAVISETATEKDYEIAFVSSDESIAAVDSEGNIKGISVSSKPVTVTVTFKYLGNVYTDSCLVYVTVSVNKIVVSPRTAQLKAGEKLSLSYTVEPDNATRKEVLWFTEDENVAVIDENGVVKAVAAGSTKVYAVTVDGFFRSSCFVTVSD